MKTNSPSPHPLRQQTMLAASRSSAIPLGKTLFTALMFVSLLAQASNLLVNPGFEADGNHGNGASITAWSFSNGDPYWINVDSYAHSGNNYYKVWGAFNGNPNVGAVWQDKDSAPGSVYQADGWLYTLDTDSVWSGDGANFAWIEVT